VLNKYFVFKKCDRKINVYFWKELYGFGESFYTNNCQMESTLDSILTKSSIRRDKRALIDKYFEASLVSFFLNQSTEKAASLARNGYVDVEDGVTIVIEQYFRKVKEAPESDVLKLGGERMSIDAEGTIEGEVAKKMKTPDVMILMSGKKFIIDAFNGTSPKSIAAKLEKYCRDFDTKDVVVVSSGIEKIEQIAMQRLSFGTVYAADAQFDEKLIAKLKQFCGEEIYWRECAVFWTEVHYWLQNDSHGKIISSNSGPLGLL